MILSIYAVLITTVWVTACIYLLAGTNKITYLHTMAASVPVPVPEVVIIVAVKDEEAEVEDALNSVCRLDYANFRIVVINDRSTDGTPAILQRMAMANPTISVMTVNDLPAGWLGKNHAMYQGYLASKAEWLLFTDADILYGKQALKKAMAYALNHKLDHLTALPEITSQSALFVSVLNTFAMMLEMRLRPWKAADPASDASVGVGAFNLVKRSAYEKMGTHKVISLRPADDLKLGEYIKKAGLRQGVVYGYKEISLDWYTSLPQFVNGLMKNSFAVLNYNLAAALGGAVVTFVVFVLPLPILLVQGVFGFCLAGCILTAQMALMLCKKGIHARWWHALMMPFAGLVMVYIIIVSAIKTLQQQGIYWRSSFYRLEELRKQR